MNLIVDVYRSKNPLRSERWRVRISSRENGKVLFRSSEGYADAAHAERLVEGLLAGGHTVLYRLEHPRRGGPLGS